jgi:Fic family protein
MRRKRKGGRVYYELVESRKVGGKVVQKVLKYLGSEEAAIAYCKARGIKLPKLGRGLVEEGLASRIEEKLKKLNSLRPLPGATVESLRKKLEVEMTYHSNAIEGNRLTLRETDLVINKGMTIGGRSMREHLEATNHKEALELLYAIASEKHEVTETDVLSLHAVILDKIKPEWAGFYRQEKVYISGTKYVPPKWREVPGLMQKVVQELNSSEKGAAAVESAAKVHYETVAIHPFCDGNGRLARLLMNLRLMRAGFPPTILRKEERKGYYAALEVGNEGNLKPFADLVARDAERALDLYLSAAE